MNKEQKKIVKKVNEAFSKLSVLNNLTWTQYREQLFKLNKEHEKRHRAGDWYQYHSDCASISDCAKLFVVKDIAESLLNPNKWQVKDLIRIKDTCLLSQSLVNNYRDMIATSLHDEDINELSKLDYIALVDWDHYQENLKKYKAA